MKVLAVLLAGAAVAAAHQSVNPSSELHNRNLQARADGSFGYDETVSASKRRHARDITMEERDASAESRAFAFEAKAMQSRDASIKDRFESLVGATRSHTRDVVVEEREAPAEAKALAFEARAMQARDASIGDRFESLISTKE